MKTKRHSKILELIDNKDIETQEELTRLLQQNGFDVTQATVCRDIKQLKLIKTPNGNGKYKYSVADSKVADMSWKFFELFSTSIISIDYAGNIVVIKSISGMAQAICVAIDSMHCDGVVGTLAGDDTIFIAVRNEENSVALVSELKRIIIGR